MSVDGDDGFRPDAPGRLGGGKAVRIEPMGVKDVGDEALVGKVAQRARQGVLVGEPARVAQGFRKCQIPRMVYDRAGDIIPGGRFECGRSTGNQDKGAATRVSTCFRRADVNSATNTPLNGSFRFG